MIRIASLVTILATAVLAPAAGATGASPTAASTTPCGTISGPTAHLDAGGTTTTYAVSVARVPCAFARTWAGRILHEDTKPGGVFAHPKGPAGWQCSAVTVEHRRAVDGFCGVKGSIRSFFWSPAEKGGH